MLIEVEKETRGHSTIEDIMKEYNKSKAYYTKSFDASLNAYLHSCVQTKKYRMPINNKEAESAFKELRKRLKPKFFVQKVNFDEMKKWPKTAIVSIFFIFTLFM